MKLLKKFAVLASLSTFAVCASAMEPIADADLSQVSGQDGVSIAADLHINIGEFKYTNTDAATGGSISFKNIGINGTIAATLDVINQATFTAAVFGDTLGVTPVTAANAATQGAALAAFYGGGDVVKIAVPKIAVEAAHGLNISVGAVSMGNSTASYGAMAFNDIKLQGTTAFIWAH